VGLKPANGAIHRAVRGFTEPALRNQFRHPLLAFLLIEQQARDGLREVGVVQMAQHAKHEFGQQRRGDAMEHALVQAYRLVRRQVATRESLCQRALEHPWRPASRAVEQAQRKRVNHARVDGSQPAPCVHMTRDRTLRDGIVRDHLAQMRRAVGHQPGHDHQRPAMALATPGGYRLQARQRRGQCPAIASDDFPRQQIRFARPLQLGDAGRRAQHVERAEQRAGHRIGQP